MPSKSSLSWNLPAPKFSSEATPSSRGQAWFRILAGLLDNGETAEGGAVRELETGNVDRVISGDVLGVSPINFNDPGTLPLPVAVPMTIFNLPKILQYESQLCSCICRCQRAVKPSNTAIGGRYTH